MILRSPEYCKIPDFHIKLSFHGNPARGLQKAKKIYEKAFGFIRPGASGPRRIREIFLCGILVDFQCSPEFPGFAVKSVDFIENNNSTPPRNPCATNDLLILFASSGHWCGLACQIHEI